MTAPPPPSADLPTGRGRGLSPPTQPRSEVSTASASPEQEQPPQAPAWPVSHCPASPPPQGLPADPPAVSAHLISHPGGLRPRDKGPFQAMVQGPSRPGQTWLKLQDAKMFCLGLGEGHAEPRMPKPCQAASGLRKDQPPQHGAGHTGQLGPALGTLLPLARLPFPASHRGPTRPSPAVQAPLHSDLPAPGGPSHPNSRHAEKPAPAPMPAWSINSLEGMAPEQVPAPPSTESQGQGETLGLVSGPGTRSESVT